jgi:hypothetical protein
VLALTGCMTDEVEIQGVSSFPGTASDGSSTLELVSYVSPTDILMRGRLDGLDLITGGADGWDFLDVIPGSPIIIEAAPGPHVIELLQLDGTVAVRTPMIAVADIAPPTRVVIGNSNPFSVFTFDGHVRDNDPLTIQLIVRNDSSADAVLQRCVFVSATTTNTCTTVATIARGTTYTGTEAAVETTPEGSTTMQLLGSSGNPLTNVYLSSSTCQVTGVAVVDTGIGPAGVNTCSP